MHLTVLVDNNVTVDTAKKIGFQVKEYLKIKNSFSVLLKG
jgi:hypothetical protein